MKVGQIRPTFLVPEKTVNFFGVKPVLPSSTLKMRKSHKKLAYTHAYTQIRDGDEHDNDDGDDIKIMRMALTRCAPVERRLFLISMLKIF